MSDLKKYTKGDGDWIGSAMKAMLGVPSNYESRMVARKEAYGLILSTCWTNDFGFETAILDQNGAHPVERYDDRDEAQSGHDKWLSLLPKIENITKLGTPDGLVTDQKIKLERAR